jgi:hypothetical protein
MHFTAKIEEGFLKSEKESLEFYWKTGYFRFRIFLGDHCLGRFEGNIFPLEAWSSEGEIDLDQIDGVVIAALCTPGVAKGCYQTVKCLETEATVTAGEPYAVTGLGIWSYKWLWIEKMRFNLYDVPCSTQIKIVGNGMTVVEEPRDYDDSLDGIDPYVEECLERAEVNPALAGYASLLGF